MGGTLYRLGWLAVLGVVVVPRFAILIIDGMRFSHSQSERFAEKFSEVPARMPMKARRDAPGSFTIDIN